MERPTTIPEVASVEAVSAVVDDELGIVGVTTLVGTEPLEAWVVVAAASSEVEDVAAAAAVVAAASVEVVAAASSDVDVVVAASSEVEDVAAAASEVVAAAASEVVAAALTPAERKVVAALEDVSVVDAVVVSSAVDELTAALLESVDDEDAAVPTVVETITEDELEDSAPVRELRKLSKELLKSLDVLSEDDCELLDDVEESTVVLELELLVIVDEFWN